jgi:predicted Zn-dependent protease
LAVQAGYNPNKAVALWTRITALSNGEPPEFLSTHPNHSTRIKDLKKHMPEAMSYYK